jgi:arsenite methyltransferase
MSSTDIKTVVKEKYGEAALRVKSGGRSCCGSTASNGCADPITSNLYHSTQAEQLPEQAQLASLGCGNPTALANLNAGGFSISAQVVALTCCCLPSGSARQARFTVWT